jgi:FkbM family methyltransferase
MERQGETMRFGIRTALKRWWHRRPRQFVLKGRHSQFGQDEFVDQYLEGLRGGTFVEVGASDGVRLSNSLLFEKERGWSGLLVEPIEAQVEKIRQVRACAVEQCCVSQHPGPTKFTLVEGAAIELSSAGGFEDERHRQRVLEEVRVFGGSVRELLVPTRTLQFLCDKYSIDHIDYLSIDTEGTEEDVLRSLDFERVHVSIVGVEINYPDRYERIRKLLKHAGLKAVAELGCDVIFARARSHLNRGNR